MARLNPELDEHEPLPDMPTASPARLSRKFSRQMSTKPSSFGLGITDEQQLQLELEQPPQEEDFADFPDAPTLHRFRHVNDNHITDNTDPSRVPTNTGRCIHFEGSLFKGKAMLWTKGVGSQPAGLFKGQRRKSSITVQGRFTRPTVMSHLVSGPEFSRAFVNLPAKWFVEGVLMKIASRISPKMKFGPLSRPFLQVPIMSLAQKVIVSEPGHEPQFEGRSEQGAALYQAILEDDGGERSGEFKNSPLADATVFDMDHVWTFHIHQHMVDLSTFTLFILRHFDITHYLDGQPLQSMIKDRESGEYLVSFEVWHEKLLAKAHQHYNTSAQQMREGNEEEVIRAAAKAASLAKQV